MKTYILHTQFSPLEYILEGLEEKTASHILVEVKKNHNLQWIISVLGLERFFLSVFLSEDTLEAMSEIQRGDRVILIDDKHMQVLKGLRAAIPEGVDCSMFLWAPVSQTNRKHSFEVTCKRLKLKAKLFRILGFDADDRRFFDDLQIRSSFFRYVNDEDKTVAEGGTDTDFFFIGHSKGREEMLNELASRIEKLGMSFNCVVVQKGSKDFSYRETLDMMQRSRCVVDLTINQKGISLRPLEALFFQRKLLTNNVAIKSEPMYHPDNVFVLGEDRMEDLKEFMNKPLYEMPSSVYDYYDINSWIRRY